MAQETRRLYRAVFTLRPPAAPARGAAVENDNRPNLNSLPTLLKVEEAALLLRVSRKAAYSMVERHQIPGVVRIGTRIRIRSRDLIELIDSPHQKPTPLSWRSGR